MNRKPVFYSNKNQRKNVADLSPRIAVKKPDTFHQGGVIAQASAQMKRRKQDVKIARLQSPIYTRPKAQLKKINEQKQLLSEQQIRNSAVYKMLQQEIKQLARRQEQQIQKLKKIRDQRKKESETLKKQQFATKLQIWELKNEVFEIKQLIQQQKGQTQRLVQQIRPMGTGQNHQQSVQNQQQQYQNQTQPNREQHQQQI